MTQQRPAAATLAEFATSLRFESLPPEVRQMAFFILKDALGCAAFGARFEWSKIVADYVRSFEGKPEVAIPGFPGLVVPVPHAALVLGAMGHAHELDNLRKPGAGVHPGVTVALPAFAHALAHPEVKPSDLVTAIVAGCEVMFRIGAATLHTPEKSGFHAPGLTGVFGAATAVGRLRGLDAGAMQNAYGISGSLCGGLLAFTHARYGGMVKRLHLGRAAEAGAQAAMLAQDGFEGPDTILEGKFGLLDAYCNASDESLLTKGLGEQYEILKTCFKRFAAHITAHSPIEAVSSLLNKHQIAASDVSEITLGVSGKVLSHHGKTNPSDLAGAQYSVPYMVAASLYVDITDPRNVRDDLLSDGRVRHLAEGIRLVSNGKESGWDCDASIRVKGGNVLSVGDYVYSGSDRISPGFIDDKFRALTYDVPGMDLFLAKIDAVRSSVGL